MAAACTHRVLRRAARSGLREIPQVRFGSGVRQAPLLTNSGYSLTISGVAPGYYQINVHAHSTVSGGVAIPGVLCDRAVGRYDENLQRGQCVGRCRDGRTPVRPHLAGTWPSQPPPSLPEVAIVARHGKAVVPLLMVRLSDDPHAERDRKRWKVQQQVTLTPSAARTSRSTSDCMVAVCAVSVWSAGRSTASRAINIIDMTSSSKVVRLLHRAASGSKMIRRRVRVA
jgi:hypothetical protein